MMKKPFILVQACVLMALLAFPLWTYADNCVHNFTASGNDSDPTTITVTPADLTCYGNETIDSIKIMNVSFGGYCGDGTSWSHYYNFDLDVNSTSAITGGCASDFDGYVIPNTFTSFVITSNDIDAYSDWITMSIDVVIYFTPTCPKPTLPSISNLAPTSVKLHWKGGGASNYRVEYGPSGFAQGSGTVVNVATDTFLLVSNLTENTLYDWYVQDSCGVGDVSVWTGPNTFLTPCTPVSAFPFYENCESSSTTLSCWSVINNNGDGDEWGTYTGYSNSGSSSFGFYSDYNGGSNDDYLVMPALTLNGNQQLSFFTRARSSNEPNDFDVVISTTGTNPSDFSTILFSDTISSTTYEERVVSLSGYTGTVYIAFHIPAGGLDGWYLYIDDITVETVFPVELEVAGITEPVSGVDLPSSLPVSVIVNNNGSMAQTGYILSYSLDGVTFINQTISTSIPAFSTDTITLTGTVDLSTTGIHNLTVAVNQANDGFTANDTALFAIENLELPYMNDFEAYSAMEIPDYWTVLNTTGSTGPYIDIENDASKSQSGSNNLHFYNSYSTSGDLIASLPPYHGTLSSLRLEFWLKGEDSDLIIGVMDDPMDGSTFVGVDTLVTPPASYNLYSVLFNNYTGTGKYIAFKHGMNTSTDDFRMDDVNLFVPLQNDISPIAILEPVDATCGVSAADVKVVVKNNGSLAQNSYDVSAVITTSTGNVTLSSTNNSIAAFDIDTLTLGTVNTTTSFVYQGSVVTILANDQETSNDTLLVSFETYQPYSVDFIEDFTAYDDWSLIDMSVNSTHGRTGKGLYKNFYSGHESGSAYMNRKIGPVPSNGVLSFDYRIVNWSGYPSTATTLGSDTFLIKVSPDCGATIDTVYVVDATNHTSTTDWARINVPMGAYTGQEVSIMFEGKWESGDYYFDLDNIGIATPPSIDLGTDAAICQGSNLDIDAGAGPGYEYLWVVDADTVSITGSILNTDSIGTYIVHVTGPAGTDSDTMMVTAVNPLPTVSVSGDNTICEGDSSGISVTFTGTAPFDFSYVEGFGTPNAVTAAPISFVEYFAPTDTTDYFINMVTDANGCVLTVPSDTVTITVKPSPVLSLPTPADVCLDEASFVITGASPLGGTWTGTGVSSNNFDAATAGVGGHWLTYAYTNMYNCSKEDSVLITVNELPVIDLGADTTICANDQYTIDAGAGYASYTWGHGGSLQTTTIDTNGFGIGSHDIDVTVTNIHACASSDTMVVTFAALPVVDLGIDTTVCINHQVVLDAGTGFTTYLWNTGDQTQTIVLDSNSFSLGVNKYWVEVSNIANCTNSDTIVLTIDPCTGIETAVLNDVEFNLYPNPTTGHFQIELISETLTDYELGIFDATGKRILTDNFNIQSNTFRRSYDLSGLERGIYFLRLSSIHGISVKQLIIQ